VKIALMVGAVVCVVLLVLAHAGTDN